MRDIQQQPEVGIGRSALRTAAPSLGAFLQVACLVGGLLHAGLSSGRDVQGAPATLRKGLGVPTFAAAYKRSFEPYLGLRWVASPVLEQPVRSVATSEGRTLSLYTACRPHACAMEKLVFVYDAETEKGWGALQVRSDVEGAVAAPAAVEQLVKDALEGRK